MVKPLNKHMLYASFLLAGLAGCSTAPEKLMVPDARLATEPKPKTAVLDEPVFSEETTRQGGLRTLSSAGNPSVSFSGRSDLSSAFAEQGALTLAIDEMPGKEFLHTVFGEQLGVSYILADNLQGLEKPFTLNLQSGVSPRRLFQMVQQVLADRQIEITLRDGVYFVHPKDPQQQNGTLGYGRSLSSVPVSSGLINQLVPIFYQSNFAFSQSVAQLSGANVNLLQGQNAFMVAGQRDAVVKAIEVIQLLDSPSARGRHIGILDLTYVPVDAFLKQLSELLAAEGLPADITQTGDKNISLVPLPQIGSIVVFAAEGRYLQRVSYWAQQLDKPSQSNDKDYYIYHPKFARAADLGSSVGALFGGGSSNSADRSRDNRSAFGQNAQASAQGGAMAQSGTGQSQQAGTAAGSGAAAQQGPTTVQAPDLTMTVDPRSNTIIFYTTGKKYQTILPMIKRLDVLPKQILLEATIAEVSLTDDFKMGFEFAVRNGKFGWSTVAATQAAEKVGGATISYLDGVDRLLAAMVATNSNINILSNPSIVVRDGVAANITVGDDIPTLGGTTFNDDTGSSRQDIVYRKTGINLSVLPTISAQGLVVMQIQQQSSDAKGEGNSPTIFERSISTEVIAQSGQTVMLGGVISDNITKTYSKVPFLADLPVLGHLFQRESESKVKKELVLFITPKVLDSTEQWRQVRQSLTNSLQLLALPETSAEKNSEIR
mgnify:CR=1 FL=1